ncbi:MAG: hypothetical protein LBU83_08680 [Bacteroidales bacterium]|jgi:hypothetical protein|nr:hypothetical protein [Bacteroidales bacterium]
MKKVFLLIAVITATSFTTFAFTSQAKYNATINTEVSNDEYVQVEFKDLPTEVQEMLLAEFAGYDFKAIFQNVETKLLKVVVIKDEEEKTFVQNEDGKFVE